jgi:hypothetical protein
LLPHVKIAMQKMIVAIITLGFVPAAAPAPAQLKKVRLSSFICCRFENQS